MISVDKEGQELIAGTLGSRGAHRALPSAGIQVHTVESQDKVCSLFPAVGGHRQGPSQAWLGEGVLRWHLPLQRSLRTQG